MTIRRSILTLCVTLASAAPLNGQTSADPTASLLAELIRVNTSNPPGNEGAIAELLAPKFKALGFEVDVIQTPAPGKAHFVARLRGNGSKRPVLLAAHADVVGVEREKWSVDPFAGVMKDGYVFGRGAIDFKGGMAVFARAAMMLAERKVALDRDVIFVAEADEEGGLLYSAGWLAQNHWNKIDAEFALNEGGWIIKRPDGKVQYVSISTADKNALGVTVTARGTSTHSSMPRPDNAIFSLARAVARLSEYESPVLLTPSTRKFFETLAKTSDGAMATHFRNLVSNDPELVRRADREISKDPLLHAIMRNTIAPVIMNAGFRGNVIPGSAEATINIRMIPGSDPSELVNEMRRVIADTSIDVKLAGRSSPSIPASPDTTALYRALERQARAQFPGAEVTTYLFQAGTDAGAWRARGVPVYGIYPYPIDAEDLTRMHGNDERVSVESLRQGTEMMFRTLVEVAGKH
ncbi:MAG TPA: M20/M25/M40 family metallo-hydrolase [Gemmatimonadaceae bacterium]|nr:M20/M25/M40 family metallo-hydrolase [Gemmatimonadaceae bacterium]